jgi:hypothetical protein
VYRDWQRDARKFSAVGIGRFDELPSVMQAVKNAFFSNQG